MHKIGLGCKQEAIWVGEMTLQRRHPSVVQKPPEGDDFL